MAEKLESFQGQQGSIESVNTRMQDYKYWC
jgi:hypothetical protein